MSLFVSMARLWQSHWVATGGSTMACGGTAHAELKEQLSRKQSIEHLQLVCGHIEHFITGIGFEHPNGHPVKTCWLSI
jgi:hypothetical protein